MKVMQAVNIATDIWYEAYNDEVVSYQQQQKARQRRRKQ